MFDGLCDAEIGHARLHDCDAVWVIDFQDTIKARHAQQHSIDQRHRAAGKRRACTTRHDANFIVMAIAQYLRNLLNSFRQHYNKRQRTMRGQSVGFKHPHGIGRIDNSLTGYNCLKISNDRLAPFKNQSIWLRHNQSAHMILRLPSGLIPTSASFDKDVEQMPDQKDH